MIGPEKRVRLLLEMRTAPQKQCEMMSYLDYAVCKQLVVPIHFTGLPNELREIVGSLKMSTKRSNAATRVSTKKTENKKILVI